MAWAEKTHGHLRDMLVTLGKKSRKHGASTTPTYRIWSSMKARCDKPSCHAYPYYGGRGISYDPRWADFVEFLSDMGEAPSGMSLDRIDNNKDYCKENCKWATALEQSNNRRNNTFIELDGKRLTLAQWGRELDVGSVNTSDIYKALFYFAQKLLKERTP